MTAPARFPFPDRPRLWGTAVSHYQVEGCDECDWSDWERRGATRGGACGRARLRGVPFELIVSVAEADDPALAVVERVRAAHPDVDWKIVVGGDPALERWNRKVARLVAAERHAGGALVMISDSNVRVEPDDLARTIEGFNDPRVGCVSNLFTGSGADSFGARIESLHLLSFVAAGNVLAAFAGVPCGAATRRASGPTPC
jgi:cellulose synthase/poly-beta-1,6-N-acetylglucosamine synthase-like glycosyltransferase